MRSRLGVRPTAVAVLFILAAAGCGGSSSAPPGTSATGPVAGTQATQSSSATVVTTRTVSGLGTILVDSRGRTLYMFAPDKDSRVTCTGTCAAVWPPLKPAAGAPATATGQARATLLGSDPDPSGGRVLTYAGWPLYTYVADRSAGVASGQAVKLNGGYWYVLSPAGKPVHTKPSAAGSSGYGYGSGG